MFERFTEGACRVIHSSKIEASLYGSESIEPHHLLLGLFRETPELARYCLKTQSALDAIRADLDARFPAHSETPATGDLPLSHASKRVLAYAAEESERARKPHITPVHIFLGLPREKGSEVAVILRRHGLDLPTLRERISEYPENPDEHCDLPPSYGKG